MRASLLHRQVLNYFAESVLETKMFADFELFTPFLLCMCRRGSGGRGFCSRNKGRRACCAITKGTRDIRINVSAPSRKSFVFFVINPFQVPRTRSRNASSALSSHSSINSGKWNVRPLSSLAPPFFPRPISSLSLSLYLSIYLLSSLSVFLSLSIYLLSSLSLSFSLCLSLLF